MERRKFILGYVSVIPSAQTDAICNWPYLGKGAADTVIFFGCLYIRSTHILSDSFRVEFILFGPLPSSTCLEKSSDGNWHCCREREAAYIFRSGISSLCQRTGAWSSAMAHGGSDRLVLLIVLFIGKRLIVAQPFLTVSCRMTFMTDILSRRAPWSSQTSGRVAHSVHIKKQIIDSLLRNFAHDSRVYKSPSVFNPERFLPLKGEAPEPDPREVCFGFGRRQVFLGSGPNQLLTLINS